MPPSARLTGHQRQRGPTLRAVSFKFTAQTITKLDALTALGSVYPNRTRYLAQLIDAAHAAAFPATRKPRKPRKPRKKTVSQA